MKFRQGFTLIELLVVVLIIGILASIAVPQYTKAVEKARITEAAINLRAIADANQRYFMANGKYAGIGDLELLDIDIQGSWDNTTYTGNRIRTKNFIYSPTGTATPPKIALAHRLTPEGSSGKSAYYLYLLEEDPTRLHCTTYAAGTKIQKKLCNQLDATGSL